MTIGELIAELEDLDEDMEVRFASQPAWPFEYSISGVAWTPDGESDRVVYLVEGDQLGYLPSEVKTELGW